MTTTTIEPEAAPRARQTGARARAAHEMQEFFRDVNRRIAGLQPSEMFIQFACECANLRCAATIPLTVDEYEYVRRSPSHFVVMPGHARLARERLVEESSRFVVVEPLPEAAFPAYPPA